VKAYRVRDWNEVYENNRSRTVKELQWVAIPNRHDGEGFKRVMQHDRASEIFTAFILILQVASRCQPRGTLIRDGRPHDASSLALKTGGRCEWFSIALEVLSSTEIGWIESFEVSESEAIAWHCQQPASQLSPDCHRADSKVTKNGREGMEGESPRLSVVDRISAERELKSINKELEGCGQLKDYTVGTEKYNSVKTLLEKRKLLRKKLGVVA
jgi:hypothetical protein